MKKVLIIDDDQEICKIVKDGLWGLANIDADYSFSPTESIEKIKTNIYDIILMDYKMPEMDGLQLFSKINNMETDNDFAFILMTAYGDLEIGVEAIKRGFFDYIMKPFNVDNVVFRIQRAIEHLKLKKQVEILSSSYKYEFKDIIGESEEMQGIYKIIKQISDNDVSILIEGETGTGKEIIANTVHENSTRKNNIFIPVNCSALSDSLLENELFGHEKGAFTGADKRKYGIFETADHGTVFLDEINNASLNLQSKLLRFIETGDFIRIGSNQVLHCDTRIIAASNMNIENLIKEKKFRDDLYHRINIIKIVLPALRERRDDILLLTDYFLQMYNRKFGKNVKINNRAVKLLIQYNWPGNVRQLKNLIQSLVLLNTNNEIAPDNLPGNIINNIEIKEILPLNEIKSKLVSDFEKKYLKKVLKEVNGNVSKAAIISKISRRNFINKLNLYNIKRSQYKV